MNRMPISRTVASIVAGLAIAIAVVGGVAVARTGGGDPTDPALTSSQEQRASRTAPVDGGDPTAQLRTPTASADPLATTASADSAVDGVDAVIAQVDPAAQSADGGASTPPSTGEDEAHVASLDSLDDEEQGEHGAETESEPEEDDPVVADAHEDGGGGDDHAVEDGEDD